MKKIDKEDIKNYWEANKKKILIGATAVVGLMATASYVAIRKTPNDDGFFDVLKGFGNCKPSRPIPFTDGFKILDIGEDVNDGCITWLDGCKLSDCGKLGEGLIKIERVNPNMMVTMAILAKDKFEL